VSVGLSLPKEQDIVRNAGKKRSSNQKDEIGTNRKSKTRQLSGFSML
jgi:hypothetical protein